MRSQLPQAQLDQVIAFHGHLCPGVTTGIRVAEIALREIGPHAVDEEVVAVVETDNCAIDAIQYLVGCTFGKGNLIHLDHGQNIFTFARRSDGKAIRIRRREQSSRTTSPEQAALADKVRAGVASQAEQALFDQQWRERSLAVLDQDEAELFEIETLTDFEIPAQATIHPSIRCDRCGQMTMASRIHNVQGRSLCLKCLAAETMPDAVVMRPVGVVESVLTSASPPRTKSQARIIVDRRYQAALQGLEAMHKLDLVFCFHLSPCESPLLQHRRGDTSVPKEGVFALRSPHRPNPIGITRVELLSLHDNILEVAGLDAWDGSPVLDIKPAD